MREGYFSNGFKLCCVVLLALGFRFLGPFLQQSLGDSLHYVALAMKLRTSGLDDYNLRHVKLEKISLNDTSVQHVLRLRPDPRSLQNKQDEYLSEGAERDFFLEEPLHRNPYGFPAILVGVHALLGAENWEVVWCRVESADLIRSLPWILARVQIHWLLVPFLSSIGIIVMTYVLGRKWINEEGGLWAALFMAFHPVDILTSQRIWADDTCVFLCLSALACGMHGLRRQSVAWSIAAGVFWGLGFLVKQYALILGCAVMMVEICRWKMKVSSGGEGKNYSGKLLIACLGAFILVIAHWMYCEWQAWGTIFPGVFKRFGVLQGTWHEFLRSRPMPIILYTLGVLALTPCLLLVGSHLRKGYSLWAISVAVAYTAILIVLGGREYRYLMPIFPFFAWAFGHAFTQASYRWKIAFWSLSIFQIFWSFYLTNRYTWGGAAEIMTPL
jgi:hypothetical protein